MDHQVLIKMEIYGLKADTLLWFNIYLSNRKQQVAINNSKYEFQHISCGVPQGYILGPLPFFYFLLMICLCIPAMCVQIYMPVTHHYMMFRIP